MLAERIVRHEGHDVFVAADGERGLALATAQRPDLMLLDIHMPLLDGISLVRRLRAERWAVDRPIIAVSASATAADIEIAMGAGFTEFLTKPYTPGQLRDLLHRLIRG